MGKKLGAVGAIIFILLFGLATFSLYKIFNQGVIDIFAIIGFENFYANNIAIIIIVLILAALFSGLGLGKSIKEIINN